MRILVIGAGRWGENHIRTLKELGQDVSVLDLDRKRMREISDKYDVEEIIALKPSNIDLNFDGYIVVTRPRSHAFDTYDLIAHGAKYILCEKPLALSTGDAKQITELCIKKNANVMVGHILRFTDAAEELKVKLVQSNIIQLDLYNFVPLPKPDDVSINFDLSGHRLDLLQYLHFGYPVEIIPLYKCSDCVGYQLWFDRLYPETVQIAEGFNASSKSESALIRKNDNTGYKISFLEHKTELPLTKELKYFLSCIESKKSLDNPADWKIVRLLEMIDFALDMEKKVQVDFDA